MFHASLGLFLSHFEGSDPSRSLMASSLSSLVRPFICGDYCNQGLERDPRAGPGGQLIVANRRFQVDYVVTGEPSHLRVDSRHTILATFIMFS